MINVLLVDDDVEYATSLIDYAKKENINMYHVRTLIDMQEFLPKISSGISMIVLDIKGMITPDDEFDDEGFLARAITYLDKEYYYKPRVILTGDVEGFNYVERFRKDEKVFRKGNLSEKDMFDYIKEIHNNLDEIVITKKYSDIFEVFEIGLLSSARREELVEIIKNKDSDDSLTIKNSLGRIRDIQEDIVSRINQLDKSILPDNCALNDNGEIAFRKSHRNLKNRAATIGYEFPKFVSEAAITVYSIGCEYGVHTTNSINSSNLKPSAYTVKSSLYSLFDFIRWFKSTIK